MRDPKDRKRTGFIGRWLTDDLHRNIDPGKNGGLAILNGEEIQTFRYDRDTYRCILSDLRGEKAKRGPDGPGVLG